MTKSNAFPLRRYSLSAWPFGTADGPLAVLCAEDRSSMIDLAHLSWALSDLLLAPAKDWSRLRAAMWEGVSVEAAAAFTLGHWLRAHAMTVGRSADIFEREVVLPLLAANGRARFPCTDVASVPRTSPERRGSGSTPRRWPTVACAQGGSSPRCMRALS
jgi:hypothetical protein